MVDYIEIEQLILLTLLNAFLVSWFILRIAQKKLKTVAFAWGSEFKNKVLTELSENPEIIAKLVQPSLKSLARQYGVPEPGSGGNINLFGLKIPRSIVESIIPRLIEKGTEKALENPFG